MTGQTKYVVELAQALAGRDWKLIARAAVGIAAFIVVLMLAHLGVR